MFQLGQQSCSHLHKYIFKAFKDNVIELLFLSHIYIIGGLKALADADADASFFLLAPRTTKNKLEACLIFPEGEAKRKSEKNKYYLYSVYGKN